jgi:hypothetical protein
MRGTQHPHLLQPFTAACTAALLTPDLIMGVLFLYHPGAVPESGYT